MNNIPCGLELKHFISTCEIWSHGMGLDKINNPKDKVYQIASLYQHEEIYANVYIVELEDTCRVCIRKGHTAFNC